MAALRMYIGNMLVSETEVDYSGLISLEEREKYNEKLVSEMLLKHRGKILVTKRMPCFFIEGVQSKMNYSSDEKIKYEKVF